MSERQQTAWGAGAPTALQVARERRDTGPSFHPTREELLEYASGAAPQWLSLLVSCHLTLCPHCRDESAWLDDLGAVLLARSGARAIVQAPVASEAARPTTCDSSSDSSSEPSAAHAIEASLGQYGRYLPRQLRPYFRDHLPRFRFLAPGIEHIPMSVDGAAVRLLRFRKGFVIPEHSHPGLEWLLVLDGSIGDSSTGLRFWRGDVCRSEVGKIHRQDIGKDEHCIALVANLAPVVPRNLIGRMLAKIVRL